MRKGESTSNFACGDIAENREREKRRVDKLATCPRLFSFSRSKEKREDIHCNG